MSQMGTLVEQYGNKIPEGFQNHQEDALLEASLVHLRILDDFLGPKPDTSSRRVRDLNAADWLPDWRVEVWLDPAVRNLIDWKVAHLTSVSAVHYEWRLATLGAALCDVLERFLAEIADQCPGRLKAFEKNGSREALDHYRAVFDAHSR